VGMVGVEFGGCRRVTCGQHRLLIRPRGTETMWLSVARGNVRRTIMTSSTPNLGSESLQMGTDSKAWKGTPLRELETRMSDSRV